MSLPFALDAVRKVVFFKRDELTTDLICCDVETEGDGQVMTWFNHEESDSWSSWIEELGKLPGFDAGWFGKVVQPTFAPSVTVAFQRDV